MSCKYLKDSKCRLGLFNGSPTKEECESCSMYSGPSRGIGDDIAGGLSRIGLDRIVSTIKRVSGKPCRCGKRRAALNKILPTRNS